MTRRTLTIAYMSNVFPAPVEPYVMQEITGLRRQEVAVIPCSARRPGTIDPALRPWAAGTLYIQPLRLGLLIQTIWLCTKRISAVSGILFAALFREHESLSRKAKAIVHTFLGAYLAVLLERMRIDHIHVHHGYFGCWIAMVAARLRKIPYSVTLHGSDLLLHRSFLDTKLRNCQFCVTVSEFNRQYIINNFRSIDQQRVFLRRMGVEPQPSPSQDIPRTPLIILAVGRLHNVKNHAFLIEACAQLRRCRRPLACLIAGEGTERRTLQRLIQDSHLEHKVVLLGHVSPSKLDAFYRTSNLVVLTSHSEGMPLSLMEAMARGKIVLAPDITGISELVVDGKTGFLFQSGSMESFIETVERISKSSPALLKTIRNSARQLIWEQFDRETNLVAFTNLLLEQTAPIEISPHENFVLQQI